MLPSILKRGTVYICYKIIKSEFPLPNIPKTCIYIGARILADPVRGGDDMHSIQNQMKEILRRKEYYLALKQVHRLTALGVSLGLLLMAALLLAPGITGIVAPPRASTLGATILGPEAGGYVLVALLAFVLGIVAILLPQQYRQLKKNKERRRGDS